MGVVAAEARSGASRLRSTSFAWQYMTNVSFFWKIGFLLLAGINLLYVTAFDEPWQVGAGEEASWGNKAIAFSAIASWVCVMYFGRMLPFLGNAF